MRLIDADALESTCIKFETHGGATLIALGSVRTAPTIDAEPVKHGRWAKDEVGYYCTACNEYALDYESGEDMQLCPYLTPYCPLCGARMDGEPNG